MNTRRSTRTRNANTSFRITDDFVLSSDESEVERFEERYTVKAKPSGMSPTKLRGKKGTLERMTLLPLDVATEIYSHLEPLDILRLSRTSRELRPFFMSRNNAFIWRKARSNVPDLPPLPFDLSEPQYANLVFESYCHICMRKPCENVIWQCRVRCCSKCFSSAFYSRPNLHSVWNKSYPLTFILFNKVAEYIPHVRVTPWKGPWGGEDKVYLPIIVRTFRRQFRRVRKQEEEGEMVEWARQKKEEYTQIMEHAEACARWQQSSNNLRAQELQDTRARRKTAIYDRLRQLGYAEELEYMSKSCGTTNAQTQPGNDSSGLENKNNVLSRHKSVRQAKDLSEKGWTKIKPKLVRLMEEVRRERLTDGEQDQVVGPSVG